jgi:hypothetical protein
MKIPLKIKKAEQAIIKAANKYDSEFDVFITSDSNNNQYYYFHFKPRWEHKKSAYVEAVLILKQNNIRYAIPRADGYKSLIWVPFNQKLNFIAHSTKEVYEINSK